MRLSFSTSTSSYCSIAKSDLFLPPSLRRPTTLLRYPTTTTSSSSSSASPKDKDKDKNNTKAKTKTKDKIIVIMGATGSGKSRLSIDLASRFFPTSEIINSDKMQIYRGLDITTNKIPLSERRSVPHHLLAHLDSSHPEVSPSHFRSLARSTIYDILSRHKLPLVVGGSNSFIHALVSNSSDESTRFFEESHSVPSSSSSSPDLHYDCCFLWVDVAFPVLCEYLLKRVDDMFDSGMFEELAEFYKASEPRGGITKAIGVPEFEQFFRCFPPRSGGGGRRSGGGGGGGTMMETEKKMEVLFREAVDAIKINTCQLARKQMRKIERLRENGWDLKRMSATEAFKAALLGSEEQSDEMWERKVVLPSVKVVKRFLEG